MSDAVIIALITAVPSTVAAVVGALALKQGRANGVKADKIVTATDGHNAKLESVVAVLTAKNEGQRDQLQAQAVSEALAATPP